MPHAKKKERRKKGEREERRKGMCQGKEERREGGKERGREEGVPKQDLLRAWALELEIAELTASATN